MQNFRHIAQNAGHTVQNDGPTIQNVGCTMHNVSCNSLNVCQGPKGGGLMKVKTKKKYGILLSQIHTHDLQNKYTSYLIFSFLVQFSLQYQLKNTFYK